MKPPPYSLEIIAPVPGPVRSSSGAIMMAEAMPARPAYDTLVIAGGMGTRTIMLDERVQAFVRAAVKSARRVASVCSSLCAGASWNSRWKALHHALGPDA